MPAIYTISSILVKKSLPPFHEFPLITRRIPLLLQTLNTISLKKITFNINGKKHFHASTKMMTSTDDPSDQSVESPLEMSTTPPVHERDMPSEVPRTPNVPDFDPIPPEKPADPPPLSPGPTTGPEFPGPPNPSPPKPEAPRPPVPSPPGQPEVFPPHGQDVIPSKPPEPGPPNPTQPDIPIPL